MTHFYLDCLEEAQALKGTIEARQAADTVATVGETRRLLRRFRVLQALLRGEEAPADVDALARDIEAQKKGEMPAFVARKLAAERDGTARVVKEAPGGADKAARMAAGARMRPPMRR